MKLLKILHLTLLAISLPNLIICNDPPKELNINDFQRTYFKIINKDSNFYQVKTGIPSGSAKDILTTGYLSKDLSVDIVMINRDSQQLEFLVYDESKAGSFKASGIFDLQKKVPEEKIITLHFMEQKNSKKNLVVIISKYDAEDTGATHFRMLGFEVLVEKNEEKTTVSLNQVDKFEFDFIPGVDRPSEPLNFQLFEKADQGMNVQNYWLVTVNSQRQVAYFDESTSTPTFKSFTDFFNLTPKIDNDDTELKNNSDWTKSAYFVSGGAFLFADLNFDCRADIILESLDKSTSDRYLEFYYFDGSDTPFQLIKRVKMNKNYSSPRLVDLRQSNTLDLVFYNNIEKSLDIFMSTGPTKNEDSQKISTFCSANNSKSSDWGFPDIDKEVNLEQNSSYSYRLKLNEELYENPFEGASLNFNFADLEMNGYPDLVFVKKTIGEDSSGNTEVFGKLMILKNIQCSKQEANEIYSGDEFAARCRIFKETEYSDYNKNLQEIKSDKFGLFDFGERGNIGFLVMSYANGNFYFSLVSKLIQR